MRRTFSLIIPFIMLLLFFVSTPSGATDLRMEYSVADLGAGSFQYNFLLTLDNHDSTWYTGQGFNWIIFGDYPRNSRLTNFVGNPADLPIGPFTNYNISGGDHSGPTFVNGSERMYQPWIPSFLGDSLKWSGTSNANLNQGSLLWSNMWDETAPLNPTSRANFEVAYRVGGPAPVPPVTPTSPFVTTLVLGNTLSFDYWWVMGINPPPYQQGYMFDVLALQGGSGWQYIGQIDAYGSSTGWQTATLNVPQNLQGTDTPIRFVLSDYPPETDPLVYLNNISSTSPVPEPSTMLLLGSGLIGLAGYGRKKFFRK